MGGQSQSAIVGVAQLVGVTVVVCGGFWLFLHGGAIADVVVRLVRRWRRRGQQEVPLGPPIEELARDIRRIAADLDALHPYTPVARRHGFLLAYDDALTSACRALSIPTPLLGMPLGPGRDHERSLVETKLAAAGLDVSQPPDRRAAGRA